MIDIIKTAVGKFIKEDSEIIENYNNYGIRAIDKKVIDRKIKKLTKSSIDFSVHIPNLIVSLTSFPQRMYDLHYTLYSLMTQSISPSKVILWLSKEEFPNGIESIPQNVRAFIKFGLGIEWVETNLKPYNKLIHALKKYPDAILATADDDIYYTHTWLEGLYKDYATHGNKYIYAYRTHRIKYENSLLASYDKWDKEIQGNTPSLLNFATGVGGVLYPAGVLHQDVTNEKQFFRLTPTSDDIWFWGMAVMNGIKIKVVLGFDGLVYINPERELRLNGEYTLSQENVINKSNDYQLRQIIDEYSIEDILKTNSSGVEI